MALPPLELFSLEKAALLPGGLFVGIKASSSFVRRKAERYNQPRWNLFLWTFGGAATLSPRKSARRSPDADVAQLVEQLIRNQQVIGSSPIVGSID
jgi:hypothetical protein